MNQHPPILIASPTRSGTTMIAGLLLKHGVWVGKARVTKSPETNPLVGTENTEIRSYLRGLDKNIGIDEFRDNILSLVETDDRWLLKTAQNLFKWKLWRAAFPDALWILTYRSTEAIVASAMRHPGMKRRGVEEQTQRVVRFKVLQREVSSKCKHVLWIYPGELVKNSVPEAQRLFKFCDIKLNHDVLNDWIEPERWHGD